VPSQRANRHKLSQREGSSHNLQNVLVIEKKHEKADDKTHGLVVVAVPDPAKIMREKADKFFPRGGTISP
jgi:hypothetical protein